MAILIGAVVGMLGCIAAVCVLQARRAVCGRRRVSTTGDKVAKREWSEEAPHKRAEREATVEMPKP